MLRFLEPVRTYLRHSDLSRAERRRAWAWFKAVAPRDIPRRADADLAGPIRLLSKHDNSGLALSAYR
jgi:hypothetical protein